MNEKEIVAGEEPKVVTSPDAPISPGKNLSPQQLSEAVRRQIEYYFSKENLQTDAYLVSQMDAVLSVPVSVVLKFSKLKALTQDEELVKQALATSTLVTITDDNRIKSNIKAGGRSTIILREIPSEASEEEIREIFNFDGCKSVVSMHSEIGDTWFINMESEDDAKDTILDLKLKRRTFRSQPVKARLKTETVIRSYFPVGGASVINQGANIGAPIFSPSMPYPMYPPSMTGFPLPGVYGGVPGLPVTTMQPSGYPSQKIINSENSSQLVTPGDEGDVASGENSKNKGIRSGQGAGAAGSAQKKVGGRDGGASTKRDPSNISGNSNNARKSSTSTGQTGRKENNSSTQEAGVGNNVKSNGRADASVDISSADFPPLSQEDDTPIPTPGFKTEAIKYSFDDIIRIVKSVKDAVLPGNIHPEENPLAMTVSPNLDLLQRQRTFSIDETREQLQQGRPVQRMAVAAGSVDYKSMMYGDDAAAAEAHHSGSISSSNQPSKSQPAQKGPSSWAAIAANGASDVLPPKTSTALGVAAVAAKPSAQSVAVVVGTTVDALKSNADSKKLVKGSRDGSKDASGKGKSSTSSVEKKTGRDGRDGRGREKDAKKERGSISKDKKDEGKPETAGETSTPVAPTPAPQPSAALSTAPPAAAAAGWGGKLSFANILKTDDGAGALPPPDSTRPVLAVQKRVVDNSGKAAAKSDAVPPSSGNSAVRKSGKGSAGSSAAAISGAASGVWRRGISADSAPAATETN